jgi:FkbH-like protein
MTPTLAAIQELLSKSNRKELQILNLAILRNITVEPIEPYLGYFAYQMGFNGQVKFGEYDNIFQEAVGGQSDLFNKDTDCVLVFMKLESLSWDLSRNIAGLTSAQIVSETERIKQYAKSVLQGIRKQTDAMILWHGLELPVYPSSGILDSQTELGELAVIRNLNEFFRSVLRESLDAYFVDLNLCMARLGAKHYYDRRYWHIGRAPYSREALYEIAFEDFKFIRSLKGKNKKCLVLDCDNTLWGGIIGEDGLSGIQLGKTHPGSAYYEFQQELVNLYNRGIIIALCSKNNQEDVYEVFRKHPDVILKEEHIAAAQINWRDKATNLRQIALDLNISLDSFVFMDDSEFEVNLIRRELPEVTVIHLPKERSIEFRDTLAGLGLFDTLTLSEEDKKRGSMYMAETYRRKLKAQATDLVSYYRSLEMVLDIHLADEFAIPRIAQQTQRTNQFNLTTRRYSEAEIMRFVDDATSDIIYLKLSDRFGDSGIVGTCILRYEGNKAIFDTFLLSCRVLGRSVEDAFLSRALKLAKKRGCKLAVGEYYGTRKNGQVEFYYGKQGFKEVEANNAKADRVFHFDLEGEIKGEPDHFKEINSGIA